MKRISTLNRALMGSAQPKESQSASDVLIADLDQNSLFGKTIGSLEPMTQISENGQIARVCVPMVSQFGNCIGVITLKMSQKCYAEKLDLEEFRVSVKNITKIIELLLLSLHTAPGVEELEPEKAEEQENESGTNKPHVGNKIQVANDNSEEENPPVVKKP